MKYIMTFIAIAIVLGVNFGESGQAYATPLPMLTCSPVQFDDEPGIPIESVVKEVRKEIGTVCHIELSMAVDSYREVLGLDDEACSRLNEAGSKAIEDFVKKFTDEGIGKVWERSLFNDRRVAGIIVNGRKCMPDGFDEDQPGVVANVMISMLRSTIFFACEVDSLTTTNKLMDGNQFDLEETEAWRNAGVLTQEQVDEYRKHQREIKRGRITDLIHTSLTLSLKLSDNQLDETRKWVYDSVEGALTEDEIYDAAKEGLRILAEPPASYSDEQKQILLMLKAGAR